MIYKHLSQFPMIEQMDLVVGEVEVLEITSPIASHVSFINTYSMVEQKTMSSFLAYKPLFSA